MSRFCGECGAEHKPTQKFCKSCGYSLGGGLNQGAEPVAADAHELARVEPQDSPERVSARAVLFIVLPVVLVIALVVSVPLLFSTPTPEQSVLACEDYHVAKTTVENIVDENYASVAYLSDSERAVLWAEYWSALRKLTDEASYLQIALDSDGLGGTELADNVREVARLHSDQVVALDTGGLSFSGLLGIERLSTEIRKGCEEIGARLG